MFQAVWNGAVLAESDQTVKLEGNHYFPPESLRREHFAPSLTTTACPWKGTASYYDVIVHESVDPAAAWCYPHPSLAARQIKDHVAFWHGVKVTRPRDGEDGASPIDRGGRAARLQSRFGGG
ncbi:MAG: DUF427 domain-containing protein [Streptosporangiaceae bacterium]